MPPPVIAIEINSVKAKKDIRSIRSSLGDLRKRVNELGQSVRKVNFKDMKAGKVTPDLKNMNTALNKNTKALNKFRGGLKKTGKQADKTAKSIKSASKQTAVFSKSIQVALGPLSGVAARFTAFSAIATGLNLVIALSVAGIIALAAVFIKTVNSGREMEKQLLVIEGLIKSTGSAAGLTVSQVNQLSQSIAFATLASVNQAREAAAVLLTFVAISGKEFKRTLRLSQDLAQLGFGSMRNAAVQLGKALEDPTIGLSALRRVGVSFSPVLREQIILLAELGESAKAVALTLSTIEEQTGGAGRAAATGLTGAIDNLGDSFTRFFETLSKQKGIINILSRLARGTAKGLDILEKGIRAPTGPELNANVNRARERLRRQEERLGPALESTNPQVMAMVERMIDPLLIELFNARDALSVKISEFNTEFAAQQAAVVKSGTAQALKDLNKLKDTFNKLKESIDPGFKATKDFDRAIRILDKALEKEIISLAEHTRLVGRAEIRQANAARSAIFWNKALREQQKVATQANRILKRMIETRNRAFAASEQQIESILRETQALLVSNKERKVTLELIKLDIRLKKAKIKLDSDEANELRRRVRAAAELREEAKDLVKRETEAVRDFTRVIGNAFEDALVKGASFRDLLKGIEEDLIRIATRIFITKPLEAGLTAGLEGLEKSKGAKATESIGFKLGEFIRNLFGFGNEEKKADLLEETNKALADEALALGKFNISTGLAGTAVQNLAEAAARATIALGSLVQVTPQGVAAAKAAAENLAFQKALPGGGFGGPDDEGLEDVVRVVGGGGRDSKFTGAAKELVAALDEDIAALKREVLAKEASEVVTKLQTVAVEGSAVAANTLTSALVNAAAAAQQFAASAGGGIGGGIAGILGASGAGGGAIGLGSTGLDFAGFGGTVGGFLGPFGKGGVAGSRGRVNVHNFDSGGVADSPSVAVFAERRGQKEAFVPLPNSGKIPVELSGDTGGGITINGPLMLVQTPDADSFRASPDQTFGQIDAFLVGARRNQ